MSRPSRCSLPGRERETPAFNARCPDDRHGGARRPRPTATSSAARTGRTRRLTRASSRRPAARCRRRARSASALRAKARGDTRVVCQRGSLKRAIRSINSAHRKGWVLRPSQGTRKLSARNARRLKRQNRAFCEALQVQQHPDRDQALAQQRPRGRDAREVRRAEVARQADERPEVRPVQGGVGKGRRRRELQVPGQVPERSELIYIQGRALVKTPPPNPPREDRHGIPDNGRCIRCNLQIDGTGAKPEDVLIDMAKDTHAKLRGGSEAIKDVGIRADRADGLVIRNISAAHAAEHGIYIHETDGYLMQRVKFFWNQEYGGLMFTSDHGLTDGLRGHGQRRLRHLPGWRARDRRADERAAPAREPDDHPLRHPPQHARLLRDDGERHARRGQPLLRQRHRHHDRLVLRRRPSRLPTGQREVREEPDLLEQLQHLPAGLRRRSARAGAGGRRAS